MHEVKLLAVSVKQVEAAMADIENRFFRTEHDYGANPHVKMIWDEFRRNLRLDRIRIPTYCRRCQTYHLDHCKPEEGA